MRKIIILLIGALACLYVHAQPCTLTGQIKNSSDTTVSLYLLYAGAHYRHQSVDIKVYHGKFATTISLPYPVFALFDGHGQERRLLLSPGRNLHMVFDAKIDSGNMAMTGGASKENILLHELKIGEVPFFLQGKPEENRYAKMPLDSLNNLVLKVTKEQRIEADKKIKSCNIPDYLQTILFTEFRYVNQCYLFDLAQNYMRWARNKDQETFQEEVMQVEPLPNSIMLVNCLFANMMLNNYIRNQLMNAGKKIRTDSAAATKAIEQLFRMPFAEIMKQADKYGERYMLTWLYAKYNLAPGVRDKILFNCIMESCDNKLYTIAAVLQDTLELYYPNSYYIDMAKAEVKKMQDVLERENNNQKIVFHAGKSFQSFKELTTLHKDNVIYVDIWGTWCGPCREEMKYAAAVRKRFAGKDIVLVYVDMDEDNKENDWKEMARMYGLEGQHYRLNNDNIKPLWKEIEQEGGETNRYPTYVLFDKKGKMIKANAARPSDGQKLFEQVDALLKE
jgi:thiol-disulfide isomerase/thioredoxin